MKAYCDTSFFRRRMMPGKFHAEASAAGLAIEGELGFIPLSSLARFEFVQGLRFDVWLHRADKSKGLPAAVADSVLNLFLAEVGGSFHLTLLDYEVVFAQAELLSRQTPVQGYRAPDILHVAAAASLGAEDFYSFDRKQSELANSQGMKTPLFVFAA